MVIVFTRQLYILIKAGIPLLKSLQIVCEQSPPGKFRSSLEDIVRSIQEGKSFSESLSAWPQFFSLFFVNMIKAAEVSGNLTGILKELSQHLLAQRRITRQVQSALMYPAMVLTLAVVILVVLLMFVIPIFVKIFQDLGGTLPASTQFLINLSQFLLHWGWLLLIVIALSAVSLAILSKKPKGQFILNMLAWRLPLFGNLIRTTELGRWCRTLGSLLSSGVTLVKGLEVLWDTTPAGQLNRALENIRYKVEQGTSLSASMEETGVFPITLVKMIQVGEESGKLPELFLDAADDYEEEVTFAVNGLLSLLEPVLIIIMGAIVGFIVISLFFPIFTISNLVK